MKIMEGFSFGKSIFENVGSINGQGRSGVNKNDSLGVASAISCFLAATIDFKWLYCMRLLFDSCGLDEVG